MSAGSTRSQVFDREFLGIRARLVELAAALDRIDRADGVLDADPRRGQIRQGIEALLAEMPGRAEQVQLVFSLPCGENG